MQKNEFPSLSSNRRNMPELWMSIKATVSTSALSLLKKKFRRIFSSNFVYFVTQQ